MTKRKYIWPTGSLNQKAAKWQVGFGSSIHSEHQIVAAGARHREQDPEAGQGGVE